MLDGPVADASGVRRGTRRRWRRCRGRSGTLNVVTDYASVETDRVQAFGGGAGRAGRAGARRADARSHRDRDQRHPPEPRRRRRGRGRRWQLLARPHRRHGGHGRHAERPHRHARHGDERARPAGRARAPGPGDTGVVGDRDAADRRAVHPAPSHAPPREGPGGHLRRRYRQPVLHHRHGRRTAVRPRSRPTPCSRAPIRASTASTTPTRAPTRTP